MSRSKSRSSHTSGIKFGAGVKQNYEILKYI